MCVIFYLVVKTHIDTEIVLFTMLEILGMWVSLNWTYHLVYVRIHCLPSASAWLLSSFWIQIIFQTECRHDFSNNAKYTASERPKNYKVALGIIMLMTTGVAVRLMWIW